MGTKASKSQLAVGVVSLSYLARLPGYANVSLFSVSGVILKLYKHFKRVNECKLYHKTGFEQWGSLTKQAETALNGHRGGDSALIAMADRELCKTDY